MSDPFDEYTEFLDRLPRMPTNPSPAEQSHFMAEMWRSASANSMVLARVVRENTQAHKDGSSLYRELLEERREALRRQAGRTDHSQVAADLLSVGPPPAPPMSAPLSVPVLPSLMTQPAPLPAPAVEIVAPAASAPAGPVAVAKHWLDRLRELPLPIQLTSLVLGLGFLGIIVGFFRLDMQYKEASIRSNSAGATELVSPVAPVAPVETSEMSTRDGTGSTNLD